MTLDTCLYIAVIHRYSLSLTVKMIKQYYSYTPSAWKECYIVYGILVFSDTWFLTSPKKTQTKPSQNQNTRINNANTYLWMFSKNFWSNLLKSEYKASQPMNSRVGFLKISFFVDCSSSHRVKLMSNDYILIPGLAADFSAAVFTKFLNFS